MDDGACHAALEGDDTEIGDAVGLDRSHASRLLKRLADEGSVKKDIGDAMTNLTE